MYFLRVYVKNYNGQCQSFSIDFLCFDVDLKITVVLLWRYVEIGSWKCGSCLAIRGNRFLEIGSWKCGACLVIHQNNVEVGSRMLSTLVTTFTDLNVNVRHFFALRALFI